MFAKLICFSLIVILITSVESRKKKAKNFTGKISSARYDNPNFIRDRYKYEISMPHMPDVWKNRLKKPYHPAWMDYCDPYHCNDYHKLACGLNRRHMKFKWFQSVCHIMLNNQCSRFRGFLNYDVVETKFCTRFVINLRTTGCQQHCDDVMQPVCASSSIDKHVVLFKNLCLLNAANCRSESLQEYQEADMAICGFFAPN